MFRKACLKMFLCCLTIICIQHAFAQKIITGKVTDAKGNVVQNASILIKGNKTGTTTDAAGGFKINIPASANTIVVSYVGFATQEINVADKTNVEVVLAQQANNLNDVVVVGYGTTKKKDLTGAVTNIKEKDFNKGILTNPIQQIQGKVAGLVIEQPGGDPNQDPIILLRGQSSLSGGITPLIVLDGVPLDNPSQLSNIPPGDIASYTILKDASATAVYGSRGANGVIIINTKKAAEGQTKVEYTGSVGLDVPAKKFDLLNAAQWKDATGDPASIDKGGNTDWQDAIVHPAFSQIHNIAVSGGTATFNYRASGTYSNQDGIVINTGKQQTGLSFDAEQKAINDKLDIQVGIDYTETNRKLVDHSIFNKVFTTPPVYPVYNPDGSYFEFTGIEEFNPVQHQQEQLNQSKEYLNIIYATINYEIVKGFKIGTTGSLSHFNAQSHFFAPAYAVENTVNRANDGNSNEDSKKGDIHLNYTKQFGKHALDVTGVGEYNNFTNNSFGAGGQNYLVPEIQDNDLGGSLTPQFNTLGSYKEEYVLASFLGRVNYNYNEKYYLTASLRRDGSSKFGANNLWGNFPSFDVAWRINKENFLKNVSWLSDLKIRAGYGVTGNSDAITPYGTLLLYGSAGRYYDALDQNYPEAYSPQQNANPDLKWEERHGKNVGLDFSCLKDRISGTFDMYRDKTTNLLFDYTVPTPPFLYNTILANVGTLSNKGEEFSLSADIISGKKFSWSINGQLTFIRTKIDGLSGTYNGYNVSTDNVEAGSAFGRGLDDYPITYLKVGYAPYVFYLPHFAGLDEHGHTLLSDTSGNPVSANSRSVARFYIDPSPDFSYGFGSTFEYGNFSLEFFLRGVEGQKIFNNTLLNIESLSRLPGNNVTVETLTGGIKDKKVIISDKSLEDASYMRLDNISLAYSFAHIKKLQSLRVYITANNLFVITKYRGLDPEMQTADDDAISYIDATFGGNGFYPKTRSFSLGVNVSF
jgi:iron complex outermembrane receptor protein